MIVIGPECWDGARGRIQFGPNNVSKKFLKNNRIKGIFKSFYSRLL